MQVRADRRYVTVGVGVLRALSSHSLQHCPGVQRAPASALAAGAACPPHLSVRGPGGGRPSQLLNPLGQVQTQCGWAPL